MTNADRHAIDAWVDRETARLLEQLPAPTCDVEVCDDLIARRFWIRVRFTATGHEETYRERTSFDRALVIILTAPYCTVVAMGEDPEQAHGC